MTNSTAVATLQNTQLPAHLQSASALLALNDSALGGIKAGGFPSIGIKGSKFFIKDSSAENPNQLVTIAMPDGTQMPTPYLDAVVIAANPALSKKFYDGAYDDSDEGREPDCSSDGGLLPDLHITNPVHSNCSTCPKNQWGSKITPQGKETKACSDAKRLVIVPSADLKFKALALDVTPAALKDYGAYVRTLSSRNAPIVGVVTRITFDPTASFPKLQFNFLRYLDAAEFTQVQARIDSDEVRNIVSPKRVVAPAQPAAPATTSLPDPTSHNMAAAVAAAAMTVAAGNAVPPMTQVDQNAAKAAAQVIPFPNQTGAQTDAPAQGTAGTVSFGGAPAETAKRGRKKAETPGAAVDATVQAAAAAAVGATVVDINTVPEPFKAAIIAAGGLASVGGAAIYGAMPKAAPAPVPAPATSFASPPAGSTVAASGSDLGSQLAALLKK